MFARLLPAVVAFLALAGPAAASDELLATLGAASRVSAFGGWVVFTVRQPNGSFSLHSWHDGVVAPVGVPANPAGFDVDVGPDAHGRPTAVYSRCQQPRRRPGASTPRRHAGATYSRSRSEAVRSAGSPSRARLQRVRPLDLARHARLRAAQTRPAPRGHHARPAGSAAPAPRSRIATLVHRHAVSARAVHGLAGGHRPRAAGRRVQLAVQRRRHLPRRRDRLRIARLDGSRAPRAGRLG